MRVQLFQPEHEFDRLALVSWASQNGLGDVALIRFPITVDLDAMSILIKRAHGPEKTAAEHMESHPLLVELPERIAMKIGPNGGTGLMYPAVA